MIWIPKTKGEIKQKNLSPLWKLVFLSSWPIISQRSPNAAHCNPKTTFILMTCLWPSKTCTENFSCGERHTPTTQDATFSLLLAHSTPCRRLFHIKRFFDFAPLGRGLDEAKRVEIETLYETVSIYG